MEKVPKIVCLGGGSAMPKAVLEGLKKYPVKLSVISAMLDSGGSAGRERECFKTNVSFGDFRRAALALSEITSHNRERFAYRYKDGFLKGHVLLNLYCTASIIGADNFEKAIQKLTEDLKEDLKIRNDHQLLPATIEDSNLCAELESGEIINGEANIDTPKNREDPKIKRVFLEPRARAYPKTLGAIETADLIIIGPGDLYSSLIQILLIEGISEAIRKSKAEKVYVCNLMTKAGETNNFTVLDFTTEIEKYLMGLLNRVIYNTEKPSLKRIAICKKEYPELLDLVRLDEKIIPGKKFIGADLITASGPMVHDPDKLAKILL